MWADGVPNLLIGLREGLEGGLVVSILLAAARRSGRPETQARDGNQRSATTAIWLGVLAAVALSVSFGAVLTFSRSELPTVAQEAFGGALSVVAVVLVTAMVFWMRRAARGLSGELKARVGNALLLGVGALALTAFLAVGREGLETALFLWTAVQASGETTAPLIGATLGILVAALLCWLLYRSAIRINLGVFFSRTAIALIVIAGGVLAYGLGELQAAGLLPGRAWIAFDLTGSISPDAWWVTLIRGVTNLTPSMTWLQVVAYVSYLGVVLAVFLRAPAPTAPAPAPKPEPEPEPAPGARRRSTTWIAVAAAVAVPLLAAGAFALFAASGGPAPGRAVTVTASACAPDAGPLSAGSQTFTVVNKSGRSGEVYLVRAPDGGVLGEIESFGPGTQRAMQVTLPAGDYAWRCSMSGAGTRLSAVVHASGGGRQFPRMFAVPPLQPDELGLPIAQYQAYVGDQLGTLATQVGALRAAVAAGDLAGARGAWLPAQLTWERVGAAYGSFGDLSAAIDGLPQGLPAGVADPKFTGLHRLEYGLWHGQDAATLGPVADQLATDVATLRQKLPGITANPADLPIRTHEILEDALRDHLSGMTDQGAGAGFAETMADLDGTRVVLGELTPLLDSRKPGLVNTINPELDAIGRALAATQPGTTPLTAPLAQRQRVNGAVGQALESLSLVPDLLEIGTS